MSLTSLCLKFASPLPDIEKYDRFMFIGPHPDDIEIGAGATAAKLAAAGKKLCFLICLDGRYGDAFFPENTPREEIVALRKSEAYASAKMLGINDVRFLSLFDGGMCDGEELIKLMALEIGDFSPDVIFAPDPCVSSECHADHLLVGRAASQLAYFAPYAGIMENYSAKSANVQAIAYYMTAKPDRFVKTKGYVPLQLRSIFECHLSQFPKTASEAADIKTYIKLRSIDMGLRSFKTQAEGFRVLGRTHMHCLPEAGK